MRTYRRLQVHLIPADRRQVQRLLQGGLQAVRVALRALALVHLHEGKAASEVAAMVEQAVKRKLVPQVGREMSRLLLNHHDLKPLAGKKCGTWQNWMMSTSPRWKMC